jgi:hypothetical protein
VGLVDREERAVEAAQDVAEAREDEALRRDIQELEQAALEAVESPAELVAVEGRGEEGRGDAAALEGVDLVAHQGDQRRDDDGRTAEDEGGELVAEALAAAGRRDEQEAARVEETLDGLALARAELGMAEAFEGRRQAGVPLGPGAFERAVDRALHGVTAR